MQFKAILSLALAEIRSDRRLARTWIFIVIAVIFSLGNYFNLAFVHAATSGVAAIGGLMLPAIQQNSFISTMLLVFQIGIIFLAFDIRARDRRDRIEEVLFSRPVTNLEFVLGRSFGIVLLFTIPILFVMLVLVLFGYAAEIFNLPIGSKPELLSIINILVFDIVPNLLFSTAVIVFFAMVLRYRVLVVLAGLGVIVGFFVAMSSAPYYLLQLVSGVTGAIVLPSYVAPVSITPIELLARLAFLLVSLGLLWLSAALYPRMDGVSTRVRGSVGVGLIAAGISSMLLGITIQTSSSDHRENWKLAHEQAANFPVVDVKQISGSVVLEKGGEISADLVLTIVPEQGDTAIPNEFVFSLNPAFEIHAVEFDGAAMNEIEFNNGLLTLRTPSTNVSSTASELRLRYSGTPDQDFAYLDSAIDFNTSSGLAGSTIVLLGVEPSALYRNFVALMPAIVWYPQRGNNLKHDRLEITKKDFFKVDLTITVPDGWLVAGPGRRTPVYNDAFTAFQIESHAVVPHFALIASEFISTKYEVAGIEFEILLDEDHLANLHLFQDLQERLEEDIRENLQRMSNLGLSYPYDVLTLVEVPVNLRIYEGGWRMDSVQTLPSMMLMREVAFPTARFDRPLESLENRDWDDETKREYKLALLKTYFENDLNGGNVLLGATKNFLNFQTEATGEGATALSFVLNSLVQRIVVETNGFFSPFMSSDQADFQQSTQTIFARSFASSGSEEPISIAGQMRNQFINGAAVWEASEREPLRQLAYDDNPENSFKVLALKSDAIARSVIAALGEEAAAAIIAALLDEFRGATYTVDDLKRVASVHGVELDDITGNWLNDTELAGFLVSDAKTVRLPDSADSEPRYETTIQVRNGTTVPGVFSLTYVEDINNWSDSVDSPMISGEIQPMTLTGDSSIEINVHTSAPLDSATLDTFLSLNRRSLQIQIEELNEIPQVTHEPKSQLLASNWRPDEELGVVVDDLDDGFKSSTTGSPTDDIPVFIRIFLPNFDVPLDKGLVQRSATANPLTFAFGSRWFRQESNIAYGQFRKTTAGISSGSGNQFVHFNAELPRMGRWQLQYHMPVSFGEARQSRSRSQLTVSFGGPGANRQGSYDIKLHQDNVAQPIEFDAAAAQDGWNTLGTFNLTTTAPRISVSNLTSGTLVWADAIRWLPIDQ